MSALDYYLADPTINFYLEKAEAIADLNVPKMRRLLDTENQIWKANEDILAKHIQTLTFKEFAGLSGEFDCLLEGRIGLITTLPSGKECYCSLLDGRILCMLDIVEFICRIADCSRETAKKFIKESYNMVFPSDTEPYPTTKFKINRNKGGAKYDK